MRPVGTADAPARIGLFGGTFDPPHRGHVAVATDVADHLGLHRVLWIPAGVPPHKRGDEPSPAEDRLEMVEAAVRGDDRFEVDRREIDRPGPSYTVDTVRALTTATPDALFHLIVGVDQYRDFDRWRDPDDILSLARLTVMDRGGDSAADVVCAAVDRARVDRPVDDPPVVFVPVGRIDVSSTEVRARVAAGEDVAALVPDAVARVIRERGLYGQGG